MTDDWPPCDGNYYVRRIESRVVEYARCVKVPSITAEEMRTALDWVLAHPIDPGQGEGEV